MRALRLDAVQAVRRHVAEAHLEAVLLQVLGPLAAAAAILRPVDVDVGGLDEGGSADDEDGGEHELAEHGSGPPRLKRGANRRAGDRSIL
jgi:hypothetical protein